MSANVDISKTPTYDALPPKRRRLVDTYISNGFNKTRAYQDCIAREGTTYESCRQQASITFADLDIQQAVEERIRAACMSADEALFRLAEQARAEHTAYIDADGSVDLEAMIADGKAHLIREIDYKGKEADRQVVKFNDSQGALDKILRAHGAYIDRKEISGPGGGPIPLEWED